MLFWKKESGNLTVDDISQLEIHEELATVGNDSAFMRKQITTGNGSENKTEKNWPLKNIIKLSMSNEEAPNSNTRKSDTYMEGFGQLVKIYGEVNPEKAVKDHAMITVPHLETMSKIKTNFIAETSINTERSHTRSHKKPEAKTRLRTEEEYEDLITSSASIINQSQLEYPEKIMHNITLHNILDDKGLNEISLIDTALESSVLLATIQNARKEANPMSTIFPQNIPSYPEVSREENQTEINLMNTEEELPKEHNIDELGPEKLLKPEIVNGSVVPKANENISAALIFPEAINNEEKTFGADLLTQIDGETWTHKPAEGNWTTAPTDGVSSTLIISVKKAISQHATNKKSKSREETINNNQITSNLIEKELNETKSIDFPEIYQNYTEDLRKSKYSNAVVTSTQSKDKIIAKISNWPQTNKLKIKNQESITINIIELPQTNSTGGMQDVKISLQTELVDENVTKSILNLFDIESKAYANDSSLNDTLVSHQQSITEKKETEIIVTEGKFFYESK